MEFLTALGWLFVGAVGLIVASIVAMVFVLCIAVIVVAVKDKDDGKAKKNGKNK